MLEDRRLLSTVLQLTNGYALDSYAGVGFQENVVAGLAADVNGQPDPNQSDFSAQIRWGDGQWSVGDLVYMGNNGSFSQFLIKGSHIYSQPNSNIPVVVYVTAVDGTTISGQTDYANVTPMPSGIPGTPPPNTNRTMPPSAVDLQLSNGYSLDSYAGVGFQENVVASFAADVNGQPDPNLGDFHAEINWGDSASWFSGDLVYQGNNGSFSEFLVKGSHIYSQPKSNIPIVVYVIGPDGTSISGQTDYANVIAMPSGIPGVPPPNSNPTLPPSAVDLQLSNGYSINTYAGVGFQENVVAGLAANVNAQPDPNVNDFHVEINWGDSAGWFSGDLVYQGVNGSFAEFLVRGSHTYNLPSSNIPIVVYITGPDGTSVSGQTDYADVTPNPNPVTLGNLSPTQWTVNQPGYAGTIAISGGSGNYNDLQVSGLPAGLSGTLSGSNVVIYGTPTQTGVFNNIVVSVQDSTGTLASQTYSLTVASSGSFLAADFPGHGVWRYGTSIGWRQLLPFDAQQVAVDDNGDVFGRFGPNGLWRYTDAAGWQELDTRSASWIGSDAAGDLVADFPGYGVYRFTGGTSSRLTPADTTMISLNHAGNFVAEFSGHGVWRYEAGQQLPWQQLLLHGGAYDAGWVGIDNANDVVADFHGLGVWRYQDEAGWQNLSAADASTISLSGSGALAMDLAGHGVWRFEASTGMQQILPYDAQRVVIDNAGNVTADFGVYGLWHYSDASQWQELTSADAAWVGIDLSGDVFGDFAGHGLYMFNAAGEQFLTPADPSTVALSE
jgi:hypothetical protein